MLLNRAGEFQGEEGYFQADEDEQKASDDAVPLR